MAFPFIPLIAAAGSALSSWLSGSAAAAQSASDAAVQRENVDKTNAANAAMAERAYANDRQMWAENNAYNSPAEQMARLKLAGLNPNLVYGSGAVGNSSGGIPSYQAPRQSYDYKNPVIAGQFPTMLANFLGMQLQQAQIDNVKSQTAAIQTKTANDVLAGKFANLSMADRLKLIGGQAEGAWDKSYLMDQQYTKNYRTQDYQVESYKQAARMSQLANDKILQDILFSKYRNEWMRQGVTTSDNAFIRMGARMMGSAGIDLQRFIRENSPFK